MPASLKTRSPVGPDRLPGSGARIDRPELLDRLDHSRDYALTLVLAPAGCGKSTLLDQWQARAAPALVARLSLTRRDRDPVHCLQRLNDTLRQAHPGFTALSCNALSADLDQADPLADALAESLSALDDDLTLLIDDFHYASAPLVQRLFARLLEQLPPRVRLIIASRSQPGFSLARLRLEDRLLLIDSQDLRLSADQLAAVCASLALPPPGRQDGEELLRLTEGWIAGIKIALLARARTGRFTPAGFHGGQPELMDYFASVVLDELPDAERDVLLATSVFERFDRTLCTGLIDQPDAAATLERILRQGLFLQPLDDTPGWYRYHPLFRRFLQARLHQADPARLARLHLDAAGLCLALPDEDAALFHARQAGCTDTLSRTLRTACARWLRQGRLAAIVEEVARIDANTVRRDPGLFMPQVAALIFTRRFAEARYCLDDIRQAAKEPAHPDALDYMEKVLALFQNDGTLWRDPALFQDGALRHHDLRDSSLVLAARHHLLSGDCDTAIRLAGQAKLALARLGHAYLESFADVTLILAERERGHILAARQLTQDFYDQHATRPRTPGWVNAGTCMAVSLYEQNRVDEARALAEALIMHVDSACATEIVFHVHVMLARLHHIAGLDHRSVQLLHQLRRVLRQGQYARLLNQLLAEELAQGLRSGDATAVKGAAADHDLPARIKAGLWRQARPDYQEEWVYGGIAAALYLRQGQAHDEALAVLQALNDLLAHSPMRTRQVVVEANRIVILRLRGDEDAAMQALAELFGRVGLQCAIRTVFDEAPGFGELVRDGHAGGHIHLPDMYLQLYADVLNPPQRISPLASAPEPLTVKEQEVMELVRRGLSNKDISQALGVSLSTTKWHLKNIFAKLQVANRTSAMLAARQPGPSLPPS